MKQIVLSVNEAQGIRPMQVADEAVAVLLEVLQAFSSQWGSDTWHLAFTGPLAYLFDLPKSQLAADEDESAVVSFRLTTWEEIDSTVLCCDRVSACCDSRQNNSKQQ